MRETLISPPKMTVVLLVAIVVSFVLSVSVWFWVDVEPVRNPYLTIEDLPAMQLDSASNMEAVLARPLFWQGRESVQIPEEGVSEEEVVVASPLRNIKLLGIILTGSIRTALLEVEGKVMSVKSGQEIQGWTVEEITAKEVNFVAGTEQTVLSLVHERPDSIQLETD